MEFQQKEIDSYCKQLDELAPGPYIIHVKTEEQFYNLQEDKKNYKIDVNINSKYRKLKFKPWIKYLSLSNYDYELDNLPENLEVLSVSNFRLELDTLPLKLKKLTVRHYDLELNFLPENLEALNLIFYSGSYDNIPNGLQKLRICCCAKDIEKYPTNLKILQLDLNNHQIKILPDGLESLIIGLNNIVEQTSIDYIPKSLKKVSIHENNSFKDKYIQEIKNILGDDVDISFYTKEKLILF